MLEENMGNYQFPSPKADPNPLQQGGWSVFGKTQAQPGGGGQSMIGGILSGFLIRDAIREVIRGFGEAMTEAAQVVEKFTGAIGPSLNLWKELGDILGGVINSIPWVANAGKGHLDATQGKINADEMQRQALDAIKDHPETIQASAESLKATIAATYSEEADAKKKAAQDSYIAGIGGVGFDDKKEENKIVMEGILARRKFAQEELEAVNKRNRAGEESAKKEAEQFDHANKAVAEAAAFMAEQIAKQNADETKKTEEKNRRATREGNEETIAGDEVSRRAGEGDLKEIKRNLDHQRATSAVTINGGLFGRSDSAALLAQRAAEQVNYLRSIDKNIQDLRNANRELTLE